MSNTETTKCKKCGGFAKPSKAFNNTWVEHMDFPDSKKGDRGNTISKTGEAEMVNCLKCTSCGHSWIPDVSNTIQDALLWWAELSEIGMIQAVANYHNISFDDSRKGYHEAQGQYTDEFIETIYKAEHLNNEPENKEGKEDNPVLSNVEGEDLPNYIKREFIEAAKEYSSHTNESVTINNPDKYKHFRNGQDAAYKILKERINKMEENQINLILLGVEFGYKQCEKGENIGNLVPVRP